MPEVLASELSREHAAELLKLEREELARLRRTYEQARREILARLSEVRADRFTAQHLRAIQVQVEAGLRAMIRKLEAGIENSMDAKLERSIEQTLAEIAHFAPKFGDGPIVRVRLEATRRVAEPRALLVAQYEASLEAYGSTLIRDVQGRLGVHLVKNSSWREMSLDIAGRLETNAISGARWKAERIVRTEMVEVLNAGHLAALEASETELPGLAKQWDSTLDERTSNVCRRFNGLVRRIDQPFGEVRGRPVMRPPALPNCRSRVIPWHQDWATKSEAA